MGCNKMMRQGPKGDLGPTGPGGGPPGERGEQGIQGERGIQGIQGIQGRDGLTGQAGRDGATGGRGATGNTGASGTNGTQGVAGDPGAVPVADATTRLLTTPDYPGQLLFQIDDKTLWSGNTTSIGDWTRYGQTSYPPLITFGFTGDTGLQGSNQTALQAAMANAHLDWIVFCGDNSYGGEAQFLNDWQAFNTNWVATHKAYPVLGNHDLDGASKYSLHTGHFTYLPGNRRYWTLVFGAGLLQIFVLNTGVNTALDDPVTSGCEPDGNTSTSVQHAWFVSELAKSTAKWKLVFFHQPPITTEATVGSAACVAMDWPEFAQVDGVFCGHEHMAEWLTLRGVPVINASGAVKTDGDFTMAVQGASVDRANIVWANDLRKLFARVNVTPARIVIDFIDVPSGAVIYQRDLSNTTNEISQIGGEIIAPASQPVAGTYFLFQSAVGMLVSEFFVAVAVTGTPALTGKIKVNGSQVATWSIVAGEYYATCVPTDNRLLYGGRVEIVVDTNAGYASWYGLTCYARGRVVK